jgi:hypothetical protein
MKRKRRQKTVLNVDSSLVFASHFTPQSLFFSHSDIKLCAVPLHLHADVSRETDTDHERKRKRRDTRTCSNLGIYLITHDKKPNAHPHENELQVAHSWGFLNQLPRPS